MASSPDLPWCVLGKNQKAWGLGVEFFLTLGYKLFTAKGDYVRLYQK